MFVTLGLYTYYSKVASMKRRIYIRDKKNVEKKAEFTLNESIMNYETVKTFNNEKHEDKQYSKIIDKSREVSMVVQKSLSELNVGQQIIFISGLTLNLFMAAYEVSNGTMTPGDFVLL